MLKSKDEMSQSKKSINICSCCSCNSSIIAREAGTRYIRDNITGKKVYKTSRSNKKKELRTVRSRKAKLIRSEPATKSKLSSSIDCAIKEKASICSLYNRQYQSQNEGLQYNISKNSLEYNYGTMRKGNLQIVGAENITKPSLITKSVITSVGDNLDTIKIEVEPGQNKSFLIKIKRATIRTLISYFCTLKLWKIINVKPKIFKWGLKDLPKTVFEFPKSTYFKKTIQAKPKLIQHKPLKTKSKFQNITIAKESPVSKSIKTDTSNVNSYIDTCFMENIIRGKILNYPPKETIYCSTKCENMSKKNSQTAIRSQSLVQLPELNRNYTINNKHTSESQTPIKNFTINSSPCETELAELQQNTNDSNTLDGHKEPSILTLHNLFGSSYLDKNRCKLLKSSINRCFSKLIQCGKYKNKEKLATESVSQTFCELTNSVNSNKPQDAGRKPKYKYFFQVLGSYKRREKSPNIRMSSMPESISIKPRDLSVHSKIGTKFHGVKRHQIQHEKYPKYQILKKEVKTLFWKSPSCICITRSRRNIKNSSIFSLKSKCYDMSKERHSSIVQYEWKPIISVNKFETSTTKKSTESEAVNLRRYSRRLLKTKKDTYSTQLFVINTAGAGHMKKNSMASPPTPFLSHSQSTKDFQYFQQFSPNPQSLGLLSHREDSTWHQTMSLRDPFKKCTSIRARFSNSYTDCVSFCECLGQHTSTEPLKEIQINHSLTTKNESGIESDLKCTKLPCQRLQQLCVMNLKIVDSKIKQEKFKLFECEQGVSVGRKCDQFKCLNLIHKRLNSRTRSSARTSTPVSQVKQKSVNPYYPQTNISTLTPSPRAKKIFIHCEQSRQKHIQSPPEPMQPTERNTPRNKQKNDSIKKKSPSISSETNCPITCVCASIKGPKERYTKASDQKRDQNKKTRGIILNKNTKKGTLTQPNNRDTSTLFQNTKKEQALLRHDSEHVSPKKRRWEKANSFKKKYTLTNCPSTETVQCKVISNTTSSRPKKKNSSFTTVTISGLITVCKKQKRIVVTQKSMCTFQTESSQKPTMKTVTATTRKKYAQKGTDPLCANHDLQCKKFVRNQKQATPKQYPHNVKYVDYVPAFKKNAAVTVRHGPKEPELKRPEKIKDPVTAYETSTNTRKLKPYEGGGVSSKRERGVGTKRRQTRPVSNATEPNKTKNVQICEILPKNSKSKFHKQLVTTPYSATSLKRCFCTTSLKKSENQVFYVPVITRRSKINDYQRECSGLFSLHQSEIDVKQTYNRLCYTPYNFVTIDCDPSECIERVIKRKQYKKINLSVENIDIIKSAQFKIGTCTQLLTSNIDILSSDKNNKELAHKESSVHSSESTQDSSFIEENIGVIKSSTDLQSGTASESTSDSIEIMCNTSNLTGMLLHLNRHIYTFRLETSPKKYAVKIEVGAKGTKICRSQTRFGSSERKTSDCTLGNFNSKMCEKRNKQKKLSPDECHPDDCALGNYNPKKCEQKILARIIGPTPCDPNDCELGNFNPKKCEKRIKSKTLHLRESKSGEYFTGNNNLKQYEKITSLKNNQRQSTVSRQNAKKTKPKTEKVERKTTPLSHVVEERRFKSLKYPFDAGISITSSISLDIEIYKQQKVPKLPPNPRPQKDKTSKSVRKNNEKVSVQTKIESSNAPINQKPQVPFKSKGQKTKYVTHNKPVSTTSNRSVRIQAKPQQEKNFIKKCVCTFLRITSTKYKKKGAKQMDATVANVGVTTKDKYLEPEFFSPYNNFKKPKKDTRSFRYSTAIPKKSLSTMTDKISYKNGISVVRQTPNFKQTHAPEKSEKSDLIVTPTVKARKHEVREKPSIETRHVDKGKMPHNSYSAFNIVSKVSFDLHISKYETGVKRGSWNISAARNTTPVPVAATTKDKTPSHKTATPKLPKKATPVTIKNSKNQTHLNVHPSLKRCFCAMKLQKPPYTQQQIVNFMTTTISPLKRRLIFQEKNSNSNSSNAHLIHDTTDRSRNDSPCRYLNSKIFNGLLNKFEDVVLTKLFCKSLDFIHTVTKKEIIQTAATFRGNHCGCDNNQATFSNEMKIIYPYNCNKFHNYTSCTMIYKANRSSFHQPSNIHYLHYDHITKQRRHKRQCITQKIQKDFSKGANKENHFLKKVKKTFNLVFTVFHRKKHRDVCSRRNNKPNHHSELIQIKKDQIMTTKVDTLKTSKSDRQKYHVVNNVDPLKTCKSDRQSVNPLLTINQQKSKRVKVGSPRVFMNNKNNTRHSKFFEQGHEIYSRFQSGDTEIHQSRKKDYLPKCYKHYFNDYQSLKCTEYNPNLHKQLKQGKKKKRKEKYEGASCKDLELVKSKRLNDTMKMKIEKSKIDKSKFSKERGKVKVGKRNGGKHMKNSCTRV